MPKTGKTETHDVRRRLREDQAQLLWALTGRLPPPDRFDQDRIAAAADMLCAKRRRTVEKVWPQIADALGDRYRQLFTAYAAWNETPPHGGAREDGRQFLFYLDRRRELPDDLIPLLPMGRRWMSIRRMRSRLGAMVRVRLPFMGVRTFRLSLARPQHA